MTFFTTFHSPIGLLTASTDGQFLTGLHIEGDRYFPAVPDNWTLDVAHLVLRQTEQELQEYFAGKRTIFDVAVRANGTAFQQLVWQVIRAIPVGRLATYSEVASMIGKPQAVRAVGTAIGRNPICLIVPCHRVVTTGGGMGGYVAGIDKKRWLLKLEGVDLKSTI